MAERISVDFGSLTYNQLWQRGMAVVLALTGNVRFPNPPVTMACSNRCWPPSRPRLSIPRGATREAKRR